jgi:predicted regulator of Ras-like GTPase activity (Roadblock/LC7/MglB family)
MSRTDELNDTLERLRASSSDIEACAVVSEDGSMIAGLLPPGYEDASIAAISGAMMATGMQTLNELQRGDIQQIFVKGEKGYAVIMHAGPHAVLLTLARKEAKLGLIFFALSRAVEEVKKILV